MFDQRWVLLLFCPSVSRFYQQGLCGEDSPQFQSDLFHLAVRQDIRRRRIFRVPMTPKTHIERLIIARFRKPLGIWLCNALNQCNTAEQRAWLVTTIAGFDSSALHSTPKNGYWCGACCKPLHIYDASIADLVAYDRSQAICSNCEFFTIITGDGKIVGALHRNVVFPRRRNKSILDMPT